MRKKWLWPVALVAAMLAASALSWANGAGLQLVANIRQTYRSSSFFPTTSPAISVDRTDNTITMGAVQDLDVTMLAGPKQAMMSFRVDLLTNPTLKIAKGTRLTLNVINIDDDMVHDLYLTSQPPPYPQMLQASPVGTGHLAPYNGKQYSASVLILQATNPGTYYYVCTIPGHAKSGMYGKIIVEP